MEQEFARSWKGYCTFFRDGSQPGTCKRYCLLSELDNRRPLFIQKFVATEPFDNLGLIRHRRQSRLFFRLVQDPHGNPSDDPPIFGLDIDTPITRIKTPLEAVGTIAAFAPA